MTQFLMSEELAQLVNQILRVELSSAERRILLGLVRIYFDRRQQPGRVGRDDDGRVHLEASKTDLAGVLGCHPKTIQRDLKATSASRFYWLEEATWRPHGYTLDLPALLAAAVSMPPVAKPGPVPGTGRTFRRNIRGDIQGGHSCHPQGHVPGTGETIVPGVRGGKGGLHFNSFSVMNEMNFMNHEDENSENCESEKRCRCFSFSRELQAADFHEPQRMQDLYEQLLEADICNASENDRLKVFGLLINLRRNKKLKSKGALLTRIARTGCDGLKRPWRQIPVGKDEDEARKIIKTLDYPPLEDTDWEILDSDDCENYCEPENCEPEEPAPAPEATAPKICQPVESSADTLKSNLTAEQLALLEAAYQKRKQQEVSQ